jgi:hypothetical protein
MSDPRIPPSPYPYERRGGKFPPHEVGQHTRKQEIRKLCKTDNTQVAGLNANAAIFMTCPDGRMLSTLGIVFVPEDPGLAPLWPFPMNTIHLTATLDHGFGPAEVEDLIGTRAAPVVFPALGNWGMIYSPTEEVRGLRADCVLSYNDGYKVGTWYAVAEWQALRPMTEIEWAKAVAECQLIANVDKASISYGPGG